jgi:hypothetical protein
MRRQAKMISKKKNIYYLTQGQIDQMKEEAVQEAIDISFAMMLAVPTNVLARCYWEKSAAKRVPKFLDECLSLYESLGAGAVALSELIQDVEEVGKLKMQCLERLKNIRLKAKYKW